MDQGCKENSGVQYVEGYYHDEQQPRGVGQRGFLKMLVKQASHQPGGVRVHMTLAA